MKRPATAVMPQLGKATLRIKTRHGTADLGAGTIVLGDVIERLGLLSWPDEGPLDGRPGF